MSAAEVVMKSLMITAFVAVMMLVVEYVNVQTRGVALRAIGESKLRQYVLAAVLGALPGCLGAYLVVALYAHRRLTLGALVAATIATSGDEMFVMLALFPGTAAAMTAALAVLGVAVGFATDRLLSGALSVDLQQCCELDVHTQDVCRCFPRGAIWSQWRRPSPYRATLAAGLSLVILALASGALGPAAWGWKRVTLLGVIGLGLFVVATVPDHFLKEHLWRHVVARHVPRIFLWTVGVLGAMAVVSRFVDVKLLVSDNRWGVLVLAGVLGLIPESGPHLVFVTLYAQAALPLGTLVASSIVQDGHGMLPLLAHSTRAFVTVKLINLAVGLAVGAVLLGLHLGG